jgi:hypothetical protein
VFHSIRSFSIANVVVVGLALSAQSPVLAKDKSVTGEWTLTVEHLPLRLELAQKKQAVTGTLDYPHGAPIQLKGRFDGKTLTFSGGTAGDNFTMQVNSTAVMNADGMLTGTLKAHFVEFTDEHAVRRERDQDMAWTAARGFTAQRFHP